MKHYTGEEKIYVPDNSVKAFSFRDNKGNALVPVSDAIVISIEELREVWESGFNAGEIVSKKKIDYTDANNDLTFEEYLQSKSLTLK